MRARVAARRYAEQTDQSPGSRSSCSLRKRRNRLSERRERHRVREVRTGVRRVRAPHDGTREAKRPPTWVSGLSVSRERRALRSRTALHARAGSRAPVRRADRPKPWVAQQQLARKRRNRLSERRERHRAREVRTGVRRARAPHDGTREAERPPTWVSGLSASSHRRALRSRNALHGRAGSRAPVRRADRPKLRVAQQLHLANAETGSASVASDTGLGRSAQAYESTPSRPTEALGRAAAR
jgi:hypothetical protein